MNMLVLIHCAPSAHSARLALDCIDAALRRGDRVAAFFDGDGVWHAQPAEALDPGLSDLHQRYAQMAGQYPGLQLLVCRAAQSRRFVQSLPAGWSESGLTELAGHIEQSACVVTFSA